TETQPWPKLAAVNDKPAPRAIRGRLPASIFSSISLKPLRVSSAGLPLSAKVLVPPSKLTKALCPTTLGTSAMVSFLCPVWLICLQDRTLLVNNKIRTAKRIFVNAADIDGDKRYS